MPLYEYECERGHPFDRVLKPEERNKKQVCICGANGERAYRTAPGALNASSAAGYNVTKSDALQLGRSDFKSAAEQDAYAASLGLAPIHENEMSRVVKKEDPLKDEGYIKAKNEIYREIRNAGGVTMPDGSLHKLNDKNELVKDNGS